jgi:Domain of unknown function (DU1801)
MVSSKETTAAGYLNSLPAERRTVIAAVRTMIKKNLPKGYAETMNWGMLSYEVPLATYPNTYNKQPLCYLGLAAQKNNCAIYLMGVGEGTPARARLQAAYAAKGKRMDMGGGCLRFKSLEELPMDVLSDIVASTPVEALIARHEAARAVKPVRRAEIAKIVEAKKAAKVAKQSERARLASPAKAAKPSAVTQTTATKAAALKTTAAAKQSAAKKSTAKKSTAKKSGVTKKR